MWLLFCMSLLHGGLFCVIFSCFRLMSFVTQSIHLFLSLPLSHLPRTSILITCLCMFFSVHRSFFMSWFPLYYPSTFSLISLTPSLPFVLCFPSHHLSLFLSLCTSLPIACLPLSLLPCTPFPSLIPFSPFTLPFPPHSVSPFLPSPCTYFHSPFSSFYIVHSSPHLSTSAHPQS